MCDEAKESVVSSSFRALQTNTLQLQPLLLELKSRIPQITQNSMNFSKSLITLCYDLMKSVLNFTRPLEGVVKGVKPTENYVKITSENLNFDKNFVKFVQETSKIIAEQKLPSEIQKPLLASFLPVIRFFLVCFSPNSLIENQNLEINEMFSPIFAYLEKSRENNFEIENIKNLENFSKILLDGDDCMKDAGEEANIVLKLLSNIKEKKTQNKLLSLKTQISSFRASLIKPLSNPDKPEKFVESYRTVKTQLKDIETKIEAEKILFNLRKSAECVNSIIQNSPLAIRAHALQSSEIDFSGIFEQSLKILIKEGKRELEKVLEDPKAESNEEILKELKNASINPLVSFEESVKQAKNDIKEQTSLLISDQIFEVWKAMKSQKKPSEFMNTLSELWSRVSELRSVTTLSTDYDGFLSIYENLLKTCFLPIIDSQEKEDMILKLFAEELPTTESVARVLRLEEEIDKAHLAINNLNKLCANSKEASNSIITSQEQFIAEESSSAYADLSQQEDQRHNTYIIIQKLLCSLKFIESHANLCQMINATSKNEVSEKPQLNAFKVVSSLTSFLTSFTKIDIPTSFIKEHLLMLLRSMTGEVETKEFIEFTKKIPFIDFSKQILDAVNNCNNIVYIIRRIATDKNKDIINTAEHMRSILFNGIINTRINIDQLEQKGAILLHLIAQNKQEWYQYIRGLWASIHSFATIVASLCTFTEKLQTATNCKFSLSPSILINFHKALSSSAAVLLDSGYIDDESFKNFVESEFVSSEFLYTDNEEQVKEEFIKSLSLIDSHMDVLKNNKLYDEICNFIHVLAQFAATPTTESNEALIDLINSLTDLFIDCKDGLRNSRIDSITFFAVSFNKMPFSKLKVPHEIMNEIANMKEMIKLANEADLFHFTFSIANYINDGVSGQQHRESEIENATRIRFTDIKTLPNMALSILNFDQEINKIMVRNKSKESSNLLAVSGSLSAKVRESFVAFDEDRRVRNLIKKRREQGSIIPLSEDEEEENKLKKEIEAMNKDLLAKADHYNTLLNKQQDAPRIDPHDLSKLDNLQLNNTLQAIEAATLKEQLQNLKKEIKTMKTNVNEKIDPLNPQSEVIKKILKEVVKPKVQMKDESNELSQQLESLTKENAALLDELMQKQRSTTSHEEQLDMILIKSNELRSIQARKIGKEELEALKYQISQTKATISTLTKRIQKEENKNEEDTQSEFSSFLRSSRKSSMFDTRSSEKNLNGFIEETNKAADEKIKMRDDLLNQINQLKAEQEAKSTVSKIKENE